MGLIYINSNMLDMGAIKQQSRNSHGFPARKCAKNKGSEIYRVQSWVDIVHKNYVHIYPQNMLNADYT